jgi:hypothetical protein
MAKPMKGHRGDMILANFEKTGKMTPDGRVWFKQMLDLYADVKEKPVGYPDVEGSGSVVYRIQQSVTVPAPTSAGTGAWDCHVFTLPECTNSAASGATTGGPTFGNFQGGTIAGSATGVQITAAGQGSAVGPISIWAGAAGSRSWTNSAGNTASGDTYATFNLDSVLGGSGRIVSMGFEVINTSAELYDSGAVTCYRMPQAINKESYAAYTNGAAVSPRLYNSSRSPATTIAEAILVPNSVQWKAKEGAYVNATMTVPENPPMGLQAAGRIFKYNNTLTGTGATASVPVNVSIDTTTATSTTSSGVTSFCQPTPFDTSGAYFTGLNTNSTLQVNMTVVYEKFPVPSEVSILPLAQPSPAYDPVALKLYALTLSKLPPGCAQSENPLGEWWGKVMSGLGKILPIAGMALNFVVPGAGAIGTGLGAAASAAGTALTAAHERSKANNPAKPPGGKETLKAPVKPSAQPMSRLPPPPK